LFVSLPSVAAGRSGFFLFIFSFSEVKCNLRTIVLLRPVQVAGSVRDPGSRFWPGHWVDRVSSFFLNQNGVVLVKKKQKSAGLQLGLDWVLPGQPAGSAGSHHVFSSPIFSSTWPDSSPGSTRWAGPGFKTMLCTNYNYLLRAYNNFYTRKTKIKRQEWW